VDVSELIRQRSRGYAHLTYQRPVPVRAVDSSVPTPTALSPGVERYGETVFLGASGLLQLWRPTRLFAPTMGRAVLGSPAVPLLGLRVPLDALEEAFVGSVVSVQADGIVQIGAKQLLTEKDFLAWWGKERPYGPDRVSLPPSEGYYAGIVYSFTGRTRRWGAPLSCTAIRNS